MDVLRNTEKVFRVHFATDMEYWKGWVDLYGIHE